MAEGKSKKECEEVNIKIGREAARIAENEIRRRLENNPDYLEAFKQLIASTLEHNKRIKKINRVIQENYKIRFEVFKRDGFRCQYCGRSPKNDENTMLQIDHIKPKSKGGRDVKENYTTACLECNLGKSNIEL